MEEMMYLSELKAFCKQRNLPLTLVKSDDNSKCGTIDIYWEPLSNNGLINKDVIELMLYCKLYGFEYYSKYTKTVSYSFDVWDDFNDIVTIEIEFIN